jgi:hypothetical protein
MFVPNDSGKRTWRLLGIVFTGAPLLMIGILLFPPERGEWQHALWEILLLTGAGVLAGDAIRRIGSRRWVRIIGLLLIPLATFFYALLDYEGAFVERKGLVAISYSDTPIHTAVAWYFLNIPFARSLIFLVIPAVVFIVVGTLQIFATRSR